MKSHKKEICWFHVQTNLCNSSIFFNRHAARSPPEETLSKMKMKKKMTQFRSKKQYICSEREW